MSTGNNTKDYILECIEHSENFDLVHLHGRFFPNRQDFSTSAIGCYIIYWKNLCNIVLIKQARRGGNNNNLDCFFSVDNELTSNNQIRRNCNKYHIMLLKDLDKSTNNVKVEIQSYVSETLFKILHKLGHLYTFTSIDYDYLYLPIDNIKVVFSPKTKNIYSIITPKQEILHNNRLIEGILPDIHEIDYNKPKKEVTHEQSIVRMKERKLFHTYSCTSYYGKDYSYFVMYGHRILLVISKDNNVYKLRDFTLRGNAKRKLDFYTSVFTSVTYKSQAELKQLI